MVGYRVHSYRLELKRKSFLQKSVSSCKNSKSALELIVEVEVGKMDKAYSAVLGFGKVTHVFDFIPYMSFRCSAEDAEGIVLSVSKGYRELRSYFRNVEASSSFTVPSPRTAEFSQNVWNLENIGVYDARQVSTGEGVKIAVIDTGVDYRHPEVSENFEKNKGYDFIENNSNPLDRNGHGTHVAGICVGRDYGIAHGSVLYAVRVLDADGSGSESGVIAGIEWALKNGIDVANLSLGSPVASSAFEDICYYAWNEGLVVVAAAGNNGGEYAMYPAAFGEPVIAVAAVDRYNEHAGFSNVFITNDVSAPGVGITSSYLDGGYATLDGTSMAAPHVSGCLALAVPFIKSVPVQSLIDNTSQELGDREVFGAGLVRADRMLFRLQPGPSLLGVVKSLVW